MKLVNLDCSCQYQQRDSSVQQVINLHGLLESCQFKQFWTELKDCDDVTKNVNGFEEAIRTCKWCVYI